MSFRGTLKLGYYWLSQLCDPLRFARGVRGIVWYVKDYHAYQKLGGAEKIRLFDTYPAVHELNTSHEIDAHYFYVNTWAMRLVVAAKPQTHVDVASQTILAALLSAVIPVKYLDYQPLEVNLSNLESFQ